MCVTCDAGGGGGGGREKEVHDFCQAWYSGAVKGAVHAPVTEDHLHYTP